MQPSRSILLSISLLIVLSPSVKGEYFFFTDRGTFQANTGGLQTIDFEGLVSPGQSSQAMSSVTVGGVTFEALIGHLYAVDKAYYPPFYDWGSGAGLVSNGSPNDFRVTLPSGTRAAGLDLMTFGPYAQQVSLTLSTGESTALWTPGYPNRGFLGFVSSVPVSSFTVRTEHATGTVADNVAIGTATTIPNRTPEPGSLIYLVSAGLLALGWGGWRKGSRVFGS